MRRGGHSWSDPRIARKPQHIRRQCGGVGRRSSLQLHAEIVPISAEIRARRDYGFRGSAVATSAGLNMGDCFAYACARPLDVPLLFKATI